jgi:DNA-binding ferritin-like protein
MDDVREDTIRDLLAENDCEDLKQMQREMQELIDESSDEREEDLLRYRLTIVEDAIERVEDVE